MGWSTVTEVWDEFLNISNIWRGGNFCHWRGTWFLPSFEELSFFNDITSYDWLFIFFLHSRVSVYHSRRKVEVTWKASCARQYSTTYSCIKVYCFMYVITTPSPWLILETRAQYVHCTVQILNSNYIITFCKLIVGIFFLSFFVFVSSLSRKRRYATSFLNATLFTVEHNSYNVRSLLCN